MSSTVPVLAEYSYPLDRSDPLCLSDLELCPTFDDAYYTVRMYISGTVNASEQRGLGVAPNGAAYARGV
ncbi:MAG: hypothetical protein PVI67_06170 [Anaerolineae bacterium]